ncbi:MAG: hypothetical protein ACK51N_05185 [bacterium]|jgi:hypothetical protein|nr:hypothetical protein [Phycisphaerales bacterium]MCE2653318.1 hypothetical protein [Planctomycetaceae bacterium]
MSGDGKKVGTRASGRAKGGGTESSPRPLNARPLVWFGGAAVGAAIGLGIWVAVTRAGTWLPLLVVLIGLGAGAGAWLAARERSSAASGGIAALLAAAGMAVGWSLNMATMKERWLREEIREAHQQVGTHRALAAHAHMVAKEWEGAGRRLVWPGGSAANAKDEQDFPPGVWQAANARWEALGPGGQSQWLRGERDRVEQRIRADAARAHDRATEELVTRERQPGEGMVRAARRAPVFMLVVWGSVGLLASFAIGSGGGVKALTE